MNKKFTKLIAAFALLVFMMPSLAGWGQTRDNVTASKTINDVVNEQGYTVSAGNDIGDIVTEIDIDAAVSMSTSGSPNCGSFWGTTTIDWRLYEAQDGDVTITTTNGTLYSVKFIYNTSNSGSLFDGNTAVASNTVVSLSNSNVSTKTFTVGHTSGTKKGQVRITAVEVIYTPSGGGNTPTITVTPATISAEYTGLTSTGYDAIALSITTENISSPSLSGFSVVYCDTENGTYTETVPSWMQAYVVQGSSFKVGYSIYETQTANEGYFKVMYGETASNAVHVTQSAAPAPTYTVTLSGNTIISDYQGNVTSNTITVSTNLTGDEIIYGIYYNNNGTYSSTNPYSDWFVAEVNANNEIECTIDDNLTGTERPAQFKVYAFDDNYDEAYSEVITLTQAAQPQVATPTFSPAAGAVIAGTSITINCTTEEATIHYTTNGSDPTASSQTYSGPIIVNDAMTIKALAVKDGYANSAVAEAAYTVIISSTIAQVRAMVTNSNATTSGIVTAINGGSVYIQDATAAIVAYNNSTLSTNIGDEIVVSGTTDDYHGLFELNNATIQSTVSTGNSVDPTVKTIAEINENHTSGNDSYQAMLVKIENAEVTYKSNNYSTLKQGENTLRVQGNLGNIVSKDDVITLTGNIGIYYNSSNSTSTLSLVNPKDVFVRPSIAAPDQTLAWNQTTAQFTTTIGHPVEGGELSVATQAGWLSVAVNGTTVTMTFASNETNASREATLTLTYTYNTNQTVTTNVTVTQTAKPTMCTVSFNINGTVAMTADVPAGTALDLSNFTAPVTDDSYSFAGWSASVSEISVIPTYTFGSGVTEATLYAVYSEGASGYQLVTNVNDIDAGTYLIGTHTSNNTDFNISTGQISSGDLCVTENAFAVSLNSFSSIPTGGVEFIFAGNSTDGFTIEYNNNYLGYTSITESRKLAWDNNSGIRWSFGINSENEFYIQTQSGSNKYTISANGGTPGGIRAYKGTTVYNSLYFFKKAIGTYTTSIGSLVATPTIVSIPNTIVVTVKSGCAVSLRGTNNGYPASLIIEDGAQLVANSAVQATVQKEIAGFGNDNSVKTGWYTIASPLTTTVAPASNMLENTYDLYYYDEADAKWYNYKPNNVHSGFSIEPNKGYLYANSIATTLSFEGTVRPYNASVSIPLSYASDDANVKGFNLVGNPFTYNLDSETNILLGENNLSSYYIADGTVSNGKNLIACVITERPIKPCEGFFVQTNAEQNLVFNGRGRGEQNGYIRILAGNESFTDRAYVQFGDGNTLRKMTLSDNTAKVYVMQDNKDYAATIIEEGQGEMPVNFKAAANGTYTVTINPEGVEMNYLHLIDNMTGMDVDLLQTPSYSFEAKTTDYESRFRLVFASNDASTGSASDETFAFFSDGNLIVNNEGQATLQVMDITGRILSSETVNGSVSKTINATPGVYMLRLVNGDNVKVQKVVVR